jgi:hypothetical protein
MTYIILRDTFGRGLETIPNIGVDVIEEHQLGYDNYNVDGDHGLAVVNVRDILKLCNELEAL